MRILTNNNHHVVNIGQKNATDGISVVLKAYNSEILHRMLIL